MGFYGRSWGRPNLELTLPCVHQHDELGDKVCSDLRYFFHQVGRLLSWEKYEFYSGMKQIGVHLAVHIV